MGSTPCQGSPVFPGWAAACNETCPPHSVPPPGTGQGLPLLRGHQYPRFPSSQHHCHRQGNGGWPREKGISMPPPHTRATSTPGNIELSNVPLTLAPQLHPGSCLRGGQGIGKGQAPPQPHSQRMGQPQHGGGQDGTVPMCGSRVPATSQGSWDPRTAQGPDSFFRFWKRRNLSWMASAAFSVSGALRSMSISSSSTFLGSPALAEGGDRTGAALITAWHPQAHPSTQ